MIRPAPALLVMWLLPAASACLSQVDDAPSALDGGSPIATLEVLDQAGAPTDGDRAPRALRLRLHTSRPLDSSTDPVLLVRGELDAALEDDLARAPLLKAHASRVVPTTTVFDDDYVEVTPSSLLCAGCKYTIVIAGFARFKGGAYVSEERAAHGFGLQTSSDARAGAAIIASQPADGASGVPVNLRFAALVLDGEVRNAEQGAWLQAPDHTAVAARVTTVPCAELDSRGAACVLLEPSQPLAALTHYELRTGTDLRDARDTGIEPFTASFTTADTADASAPRLHLLPCAPDEVPVPVGCAVVDDERIELRVTGEDIARVVVQTASGVQAQLATRNEVTVVWSGMKEGQRLSGSVTVFDLANHSQSTRFAATTEANLPKLSITEVRADPIGPEPQQEFVELTNYGTQPIALSGFALSDSSDDPGMPMLTNAIAYPGARVLLVADDFDADSPLDGPIPPGAALVRVGPSLGRSGLSNSGDALFLRDPSGRRVSAAPASKAPRAGACLQRRSDDMRSGAAGGFGYDSAGGCTPGH